jgi:endonuclease/exonuclease/phosphatase family metal-dependent hydrolase
VRKITDRVILVLNLVSAAGMLVAYLAPLVNPARFFIPALFGLAYPYLLILNLGLLCYWIIRLKKEALIPLLVILLGWNQLNNLLPFSGRHKGIPETAAPERFFSILSYNVRGFDRYHWRQDPNTRMDIFHFIHAQDPDILCFQEYFTYRYKDRTQSDLAAHLKQYPESALYFISNVTGENGYGIATYSKFPILRSSRIPFNSSSNGALYTDLLIREDTVRVFNIHLQSFRFEKENYAFMDTLRLAYSSEQMKELKNIGSRMKQAYILRAEQARMISSYLHDSPHPVVVVGDFNDTPQSYAYRKIRKGLQDAFRKSGKGFGNTYFGEFPSFRIDHILVGGPLIPSQFKRLKVDYSDHFPITAEIYLPVPINDE